MGYPSSVKNLHEQLIERLDKRFSEPAKTPEGAVMERWDFRGIGIVAVRSGVLVTPEHPDWMGYTVDLERVDGTDSQSYGIRVIRPFEDLSPLREYRYPREGIVERVHPQGRALPKEHLEDHYVSALYIVQSTVLIPVAMGQ